MNNEASMNGKENLTVDVVCAMCTDKCNLHVKFENGKPYVSGSRCPRGDKYGAQKLLKTAEGY